jgi:type I restriction enzyme M protein
VMSDEDVEVIDAAYKKGVDLDGDGGLHLRLVDVAEIAQNGFDLNIGRYIKTEAAPEVDVKAALAAYRDARAALRAAEQELDRKLKAAGFDA